jgi:hypothetical protein
MGKRFQPREAHAHGNVKVSFTLVNRFQRLRIPTPLCRSVLEMIHELETGKRRLGMQNHAELRAALAV